MSFTIGTSAHNTFVVSEGDTAIAMRSGDVPVLGTPRLIAWCEEVTVQALASQLPEGATSVGFKILIDHLAPTTVGAEVKIEAKIVEVDGRQVHLQIVADDKNGRAAEGTIVRVVVDRQKFLSRLS